MVPPEYFLFFATMAAVGATLFGLIFVAISIVPESITTNQASLERQIKAASAYIALLNPFVVSLFALVPHILIGGVAISLSFVGLINTIGMIVNLMRASAHANDRFRTGLFVLGGLFLYCFEAYLAVRLIITPTDAVAIFLLADLLIFLSIYGVVRAWDLIGVRKFRLQDWFRPVDAKEKHQ